MSWQSLYFIGLSNNWDTPYSVCDKNTNRELSAHSSRKAAEQAAERRYNRLMRKIEKQVFE